MKKLYVITGGSGTGKSTVLKILAQRGYPVVEEQARIVIAEESKKKDGILVADPRFQVFLAQRQLAEEQKLPHATCFLDRSIIDNIAYQQLSGRPIPPELERMILNSTYEKKVFLMSMPPESKFGKEGQTYATYEVSVKIQQLLIKAYTDRGYELIVVPFGDYNIQADFIEETVKRLHWH